MPRYNDPVVIQFKKAYVEKSVDFKRGLIVRVGQDILPDDSVENSDDQNIRLKPGCVVSVLKDDNVLYIIYGKSDCKIKLSIILQVFEKTKSGPKIIWKNPSP